MTTRRFSTRIVALTAAYALALQALLAAVGPAAQPAGIASSAELCASTPAGLPAGQDHAPCALHCLIAGCGFGGMALPATAVAAHFNPAGIRIASLTPVESLDRATRKNPQAPRAPPRA